MKNFSIKSHLPKIKKENLTWIHQNFLVFLFFLIVNTFKKNIRKIFRREISENSECKKVNFIPDCLIIFISLIIVCSLFLCLPILVTPDDPLKTILLLEFFCIVFFSSIAWTGYVFLIQEFQDLIREKILVTIEKPTTPENYRRFLQHFFNGVFIEFPSGFGFRFYLITILAFLTILNFTISQSSFAITSVHALIFQFSLTTIILFFMMVFTIALMLFVTFIIFSIEFTSIAILFFLFYTAQDLQLDINVLIEMGGTEKYGRFIVNCMYLFAFALGIFPLIQLIPKMQAVTFQIPQLDNLTFGNVTVFLKTTIYDPFSQMPISSFSNYHIVILTFILYTGIAVAIMFFLHVQIKEEKVKELDRLEGMIKYIDFFNTDGPANRERNQYLLYLYERVSNLHEWPMKKIFVLDLFISALLLFISSIFGKL
jgi:hypothetical protein